MPLTVTATHWSFSKKNANMPLNQNPHQKVILFGCVGFSNNAREFSVPQRRQFYIFTYPLRSKWASSGKMIFFFLPKSASSVSRSQIHLAKRKRIEWSIGFNSWIFMASYQGHYAKFISMMSLKCLIVENDGELMLMALHAHFLLQHKYSRVYAQCLTFHAFHFFHRITKIRSWPCLSSSRIRMQFSHTFERIHNHIRSAEG